MTAGKHPHGTAAAGCGIFGDGAVLHGEGAGTHDLHSAGVGSTGGGVGVTGKGAVVQGQLTVDQDHLPCSGNALDSAVAAGPVIDGQAGAGRYGKQGSGAACEGVAVQIEGHIIVNGDCSGQGHIAGQIVGACVQRAVGHGGGGQLRPGRVIGQSLGGVYIVAAALAFCHGLVIAIGESSSGKDLCIIGQTAQFYIGTADLQGEQQLAAAAQRAAAGTGYAAAVLHKHAEVCGAAALVGRDRAPPHGEVDTGKVDDGLFIGAGGGVGVAGDGAAGDDQTAAGQTDGAVAAGGRVVGDGTAADADEAVIAGVGNGAAVGRGVARDRTAVHIKHAVTGHADGTTAVGGFGELVVGDGGAVVQVILATGIDTHGAAALAACGHGIAGDGAALMLQCAAYRDQHLRGVGGGHGRAVNFARFSRAGVHNGQLAAGGHGEVGDCGAGQSVTVEIHGVAACIQSNGSGQSGVFGERQSLAVHKICLGQGVCGGGGILRLGGLRRRLHSSGGIGIDPVDVGHIIVSLGQFFGRDDISALGQTAQRDTCEGTVKAAEHLGAAGDLNLGVCTGNVDAVGIGGTADGAAGQVDRAGGIGKVHIGAGGSGAVAINAAAGHVEGTGADIYAAASECGIRGSVVADRAAGDVQGAHGPDVAILSLVVVDLTALDVDGGGGGSSLDNTGLGGLEVGDLAALQGEGAVCVYTDHTGCGDQCSFAAELTGRSLDGQAAAVDLDHSGGILVERKSAQINGHITRDLERSVGSGVPGEDEVALGNCGHIPRAGNLRGGVFHRQSSAGKQRHDHCQGQKCAEQLFHVVPPKT